MSEPFLTLSAKEQGQILRTFSINENIRRDAIILEKDIWICWALDVLFKIPNKLPMAFKGGTSLSKAFKVIERFSEDVDITIDYQSLDCEDPFIEGTSKTKIKNISQQIKTKVTEQIKTKIIPYFQNVIAEQFKQNPPTIVLDEDGETLHLYYSSSLDRNSDYIRDSVKLEFGGRNLNTPNNSHKITADIAGYIDTLSFPTAEVIVLSPEKTFWEKLTLIHTECNRTPFKEDANRTSRHWYDIFMLSQHDIGKQAATNRGLLEEVIRIKKVFYNSGFAKYDDCLNGSFRLIPNNDCLQSLKKDFKMMVDNKMFYDTPPSFNSIIEHLGLLEKELNRV